LDLPNLQHFGFAKPSTLWICRTFEALDRNEIRTFEALDRNEIRTFEALDLPHLQHFGFAEPFK